jgi:hypothetical protein
MRRATLIVIACIAAIPLLALAGPQEPGDRMLVHEWGTFTVLQDEQGKPVIYFHPPAAARRIKLDVAVTPGSGRCWR